MSGMTWLNPLGLWWLLLVPALIAVYMLRAKPQRRTVSSLRLWRRLPDIDRPKARIRRPPLSLLLFLQLLLLAAGAIALVRPALTAPATGRTTILLDASGSMLASDGGSTRFERARSEAMRLARDVGAAGRGTLLRVASTVTTLCKECTSDDLQRAVQSARPGAGTANWDGAMQVAAGLAAGAAGKTETAVISDGAFPVVSSENTPPFIRFVRVGGDVANRAITSLSARRPPDGSPGYEAYARVDNYGEATSLDVSSLADTVPQPSRHLEIPAGAHADLVWNLPPGTRSFTVSIDSNDALSADNRAVLFLPDKAHKVRIISSQPDLYARVLSGIPGLETTTARDAGESDMAFTIVDGRAPSPLPSGGLLLINPQADLLPSTGEVESLRPVLSGSSHPLVAGIDLRALFVLRARSYTPPPWMETVLTSDRGPLILAGENGGQRVAVLTFDPNDSNLPKLAAFPLLMSNLVDWLYPLADTQALRPGEATRLQPGVVVKKPDGNTVQAGPGGEFADTDSVGVYEASPGATNSVSFAVNMTSAEESNLAPLPHPELDRLPPGVAEGRVPGQELWPPLAALALVLAGVEWVFYSWKRGRI